MYRTNHPRWKLTHILCILGHLGLIIAGVVAFIHNLESEADNFDSLSQQPTSIVMNMSDDQTVINADTKSCTIVLVQGLGSGVDEKSGNGHSNFGIIVNELLPVASVIVVSHFFFFRVGIGVKASARSVSLVHHHNCLMAALHQSLLPFSVLIAPNAEYTAPAG